MAAPVWVLSVDLQTKTATFTTGLADAAKSARGSFQDIQGGASRMGAGVSYSMRSTRESVMLVAQGFGIHLPRALSSFIASLGPVGAAMEAAFPFIAIVAGAVILMQQMEKLRAAGIKLTNDQVNFGTAVNNVFNALDEKMLQAQIRADDLKDNHLAGLHDQLKLIDMQSMAELVHSFEEVAKAADVVMQDLKWQWYESGKGSEGAKTALDQFKVQYESLLSAGKSDEAHGLLTGTLAQAQRILALQNTITGNRYQNGGDKGHQSFDPAKEAAAETQLHQLKIGFTKTEVEVQQNLVEALQAQLGAEQRIADIKALDKTNAKTADAKADAGARTAAARQEAESQLRMSEQSIAADRAAADTLLTTHRASLETRLASDIDFAGRTRDVQLAANQAEIAGLDRSGKDYQNQLKALKDKTLEIGTEYDTRVAELTAKASAAEYSRDLVQLEQNEREKIEATRQGSAQRLTAIDMAITQEEAANLQETNFFRELLNQRVQNLRQEAEEEGKLRAEAAREGADNDLKMGELSINAEKQRTAMEDSARRVTAQQRVAEETKVADEEYAIKMAAFQKEEAGLDKSGADYDNKLKTLQDKEKELVTQHEDQITQIKEKAEEERNRNILAAETRFNDTIARGLTQTIMGHESFAKMMNQLGNQVVSGMIENAIKSMLADDMTKEKDAAAAARKAFNLGLSMGGPAGWILGPVMGAKAFIEVMAFAQGADRVPGVGGVDSVPSMLTPGEGIVPSGVMDQLSQLARNGGLQGGGTHYHVHVRPTYHVNTIDGDGMEAALKEHTDVLQRHVENSLRRMNH